MQGFTFESTLTFPITIDVNQMKMKLDIDGFPYTINYDNNLVLYKIDHEKCIRLSYMLYLLQIKLIRITLAQYIQICLDIIQKMFELNENNISHNYLSVDRIWLEFIGNSLNVMPQKLKYKIHFVGYDCPFYERIDQKQCQIEDDYSVKQIVKSILMFSRKYKKKKNLEKAEQQGIFKKLIDEGIDKHGLNQIELLQKGFKRSFFDSFIQQSKLIFDQYGNQQNKIQQLQNIDTEFKNDNFRRSQRIKNVIQNFKELQHQNHTKDTHILQYQIILHKMLPQISKELRKAVFYQNQTKLDKGTQKKDSKEINKDKGTQITLKKDLKEINKDKGTQITIKKDLKKINKDTLQKLIEDGIKKSLESYKFAFDSKKIEQEISKQISISFQILDYFYNDCNYYIDPYCDIDQAIENFKDEKVKLIVENYFDLIIQLNILELIQSII